jgi:arylsulfate sulfotransferase
MSPKPILRAVLVISLTALLAGCGGSDPTLAEQSNVIAEGAMPGATPFISFVGLRGVERAASINYIVAAKPGSQSRPISVTQSVNYLVRRGYATPGGTSVRLPVFGLYAGAANAVSIIVSFLDGSTISMPITIETAPYSDPGMVYDRPKLLMMRAPGSALGFDYFFIRSGLAGPVIVDTDGEIRWVGVDSTTSVSSLFTDNGFVVGGPAPPTVRRFELDGTTTVAAGVGPTAYTNFHHNFDPGKFAVLGEVDAVINGQNQVENILIEFNSAGAILAEWQLGEILADYMRSQGDDPSLFVRPGFDWFHMNAAVYDPSDDSIIVSSRENFVIKIGYSSRSIIWILGDPMKYWHSFASLRAKSLTLLGGGLYPIGQHAVSISPNGLLLLFNNGTGSLQQPAGAPIGESRAYSAVSAYSIDVNTRTASEVWRFDHGRSVLSQFCSSVYQTGDGSALITYAMAGDRTKARVIGLDKDRQVILDFEYANPGATCSTAWNAHPLSLEAMSFN